MHSIKIPLILQAQLKFSLPMAASLLLLIRNNYPWNFRINSDLNTCMCMAESLCCPPETITTLLIDCTPIQNKKLKKSDLKGHIRASFIARLVKNPPAMQETLV